MKQFVNKHYSLLFTILIVLFIIMKELILQSFISGTDHFKLNIIDGLVFVNGSLVLEFAVFLLFLSIGLLNKGKTRYIYFLILDLLVTTFCIVDSCYTRFFQGVSSVFWLAMPASTANISTLRFELYFSYFDFLFLIDLPILIFMLIYGIKKHKFSYGRHLKLFTGIVLASVITLCVPLTFPKDVKHKIYSSENSADIVANFTILGYHIIDVIQCINLNDVIILTTSQKEDINTFYDTKNENLENNSDFGILKNENLIIVQLESVETFVIGNSINGKEITPNMNKYLSNSYYYTGVHEQVRSGNSCDCDLMVLTGCLPVGKGVTFSHFSDTDFVSLPELLREENYFSSYMHGDHSGTWNYEGVATTTMGYDEINLDIPSTSVISGYISDEDMLAYASTKIASLDSSYENYMAYVTLTSSHLPFSIAEEYRELDLPSNMDNYVQGYLQAVHYVDKQLGLFMDYLDSTGVLDNATVVFLGDHGGIHKYCAHRVDKYVNEYSFFGTSKDYTMPLIVYNKNKISTLKQIDVIGGQSDIMPTLCYMYGIDSAKYKNTAMGRPLCNTNRNYVFLSTGRYIGTLDPGTYKVLKKSYYISDLIIRSRYFNAKD